MVTIWELSPEPGKITKSFSEFQKSDESTFASAEEVIDYLTPYMGFNSASGGSGAARSTARLMKSGQVQTYISGDDGDNQSGRGVDFFTLVENNPFGNTARFTDTNGGSLYSNDIVIDWSTYDGEVVLGYYKGDVNTDRTFDEAIDWASLLVADGFSSWHLMNIKEALNIAYYGMVGYEVLKYDPFYLTGYNFYWTSTATVYSGTSGYVFGNAAGDIGAYSKSNPYNTIACRFFTLNELGL